MFAYYTAARWFGMTLDLVLCMFCALVGLLELYTVKDSSTAGNISSVICIYFINNYNRNNHVFGIRLGLNYLKT
jgi:hypothetical protein